MRDKHRLSQRILVCKDIEVASVYLHHIQYKFVGS